jgi:Carboxypeptidase regulatory-like domain/TonB dependent receptor/TonB-dependent Receptor Plug Domain
MPILRFLAGQALLIVLVVSPVAGRNAQTASRNSPPAPASRLSVLVTDENEVSVPGARVLLQSSTPGVLLRCQTDYSGRCQFLDLAPGSYQVRVEKQGFYATVQSVQVGQTFDLDVVLSHQREVREVVNVVESPPAIDPQQTSSQEQLTGLDVINIPYPVTRDYRNVLNYIPGVINDVTGQPHVAGAETYQTLALLDGFNVSQPANGQLLIRVSSDAFRSINVQTSRYSAEYGKASGGVIDLVTGIGDDHFRFVATDFIPSVQNKKGLELDKVTPRFTLSGPIRKSRIWFFDGADGEYDNIVISELPRGQDHDIFWRVGNLAKLQANISSRNILTTGFDYNLSRDQYSGLSLLSPPSASPAIAEPVYQASVKDQHYFAGGELLEAGFGFNRYDLDQLPHGVQPYFVSPETTGGSYYFKGHTQAERWQALSNLYLPPKPWHGRHEFKLGVDLDRLAYDFNFFRQPISFLRQGQSLLSLAPGENCFTITQPPTSQTSPCSRYSIFLNGPSRQQHNTELSGYFQDRWLFTNRFLIEAGLRYDWDEIVRHSLLSPRIATTYVLDHEANTKLATGVGVVFDATPLFLIARPSSGERIDYFFSPSGQLTAGPITTFFSADRNTLQAPRFLNWSIEIERKLPGQIYLKAEFTQKRGVHEFVYNSVGNGLLTTPTLNNFILQNSREDRYDSFQIVVRRTFQKGHALMASYARARARSNQVLDFNLDNPVFSPQASGPYPWDAPNRVLAWGFLPLIRGFDLAYSSEWRTGFPFNVVNNQQQLVEPPGSRRFPTFFVLNLHLEKRFAFLGYHWALRGGFDNITDRRNPGVVNNDIDSPQFLTYGGFTTRGFTTRLRFLGRK